MDIENGQTMLADIRGHLDEIVVMRREIDEIHIECSIVEEDN
jgi:hypothetical protein